MLPIATAGLALSHAKVPASYISFSIHDKVLLRFIAKSLLLAQVVNLCLSLLYVSIIGKLVNEPLSSHTALVLVFSSVVLTLACFALRLWTTSLVSWIVIIFFVVAGLPISTGDFATHLFVCCRSHDLGFKRCHLWLYIFYRDSVGCDKFGVFSEVGETCIVILALPS